MMITNLLMRLKDGHIQRGWVDGKEIDDATMVRLFRVLDKADSYDKQRELIGKYVKDNSYNKDAGRCVSYTYKREKVEVNQCVYHETADQYSRGKHLNTITL